MIIIKMTEICILKKMRIFVIPKKTIKLTIMKKSSTNREKKNYRITIIFRDQVIVERYYREDIAIKTVSSMRELFPKMFVGGAIEEKKEKWEVIWTLVPDIEMQD
jgi:hypothetical protein